MTTPLLDSLHDRMVAIDNWLEREAGPLISSQLHLDRDTSECAYWHLGYSQAMADILRAMALTPSRDSISDKATLYLVTGQGA